MPKITDITEQKCRATLAALEAQGYPQLDMKNAAIRAGIADTTARRHIAWLEYRTRPSVPVSEDQTKAHYNWTKEECIQELIRIVNLDLDKVVSRNYFRVNSQISESTWNAHFGTFEEFKRQAGVVLSRQQHQVEKHIAKHASVDHYKHLNLERQEWGEAYVRENNKRYKTALVCSDLHDIECDKFFLRILLDVAKRSNPDLICLAGDIFDLAEFGKFAIDCREWDVVGRIKFAHNSILRPLREICPDATIDLLEGNHEFRLLRHMADATPALRVVLSDLHGMTIGKLLGLEEFEINYVAQGDLGAYSKKDIDDELRKNYRIYWGCWLAHHFPDAKNMGMPGVNGHHHKHISTPMFNPMFGEYEWHQLGSGHKRDASYCNGEKWHNGLALIHADTEKKRTNIEYIPVTDFCVAGGKYYFREDSEKV